VRAAAARSGSARLLFFHPSSAVRYAGRATRWGRTVTHVLESGLGDSGSVGAARKGRARQGWPAVCQINANGARLGRAHLGEGEQFAETVRFKWHAQPLGGSGPL